MAALEEQVRQLQSKGKKSNHGCETCNRGQHGEKGCPGLKMKCFTCNEVCHLVKSAACKRTSGTEYTTEK